MRQKIDNEIKDLDSVLKKAKDMFFVSEEHCKAIKKLVWLDFCTLVGFQRDIIGINCLVIDTLLLFGVNDDFMLLYNSVSKNDKWHYQTNDGKNRVRLFLNIP